MGRSHIQTHGHGSGNPRPLLLSFSGIDGAGKTTQIEKLTTWLQGAGLRVCLIKFWDDVATLRRLREELGHILFRGERGVGTPDRPVQRRDKNVRSWYMLPVRLALCLLDAVRLRSLLARIQQRQTADAVIFDRYLYDQLANLHTNNRLLRVYFRLLLNLVPRPDAAFLLDVDPVVARARKPEYPLEFLCHNRDCYFGIAAIAGLSVIPPDLPEDVASCVRRELAKNVTGLHDQAVAYAFTSRSG